MLDLGNCDTESVVKFLPVLLDRLIKLMVKPPMLLGQPANLASTCFTAIARVVHKLAVS